MIWKVTAHETTQVQQLDVVNFILSKDKIALDIETTGLNYLTKEIVAVGVGDYDTQYVVTDNIKDIMETVIFNSTMVSHNAMFELCFAAYHYSLPVAQANIIDTYQLELTLTNGTKQSRSYKYLVDKYLDVAVDKTEQTTFKSKDLTTEQIQYLANDVKYLIPLADKQTVLFKEVIDSDHLYKQQNQIIATMAAVTTKGTKFSHARHQELIQEWKLQLDVLEEQIVSRLVRPINLNSSQQLLKWFHEYDKSIRSTGKPALEKYLMNGGNEDLKSIIREILSVRKLSKLLSTYGDKFSTFVHNDRIRTLVSTNTTTGRFASSDVYEEVGINPKTGKPKKKKVNQFANLQNIPSNKLKECFVPEDNEDMVTMDLDGCELRILADQSKDPLLIAGVAGEVDLHSILATGSYRIIKDDPEFIVDKSSPLRKKHKPALFGMIYGAKPNRIAEVLNIPLPLAKKVWANIRQQLHMAFDYLDNFVKESLSNGMAIANTVSRKPYFLTEYKDYVANGVEHPQLYRIIKRLYNYPMQATNADMICTAIIEVEKLFRQLPGCQLRMSVYDELVYTRPKGWEYIDELVANKIKESCNIYLTSGLVKMELSTNVTNYWSK